MSLPLTRRAVQLDLGVEPRNPAALAIHPGSGSLSKNWPPARWRTLAESMLSVLPADATLAVIGGEADAAALDPLRSLASDQRVVFWENLPLPELAAKLAGCRCFAGHDTGVSHLAATTGTPALLLFGPTDPGVWAPPHAHVQVLRAPGGNWDDLLPDAVAKALGRLFLPARLASSQAGG
jgi:heptosyltransferase-2